MGRPYSSSQLSRSVRGFSCQKLGQNFLAMREDLPHLALNEQRVGHRSQRAVSHLVFNFVPHQCAAESVAIIPYEFMSMVPSLERTFLLHVGKVVVPFEFGDGCGPFAAPGEP